MQGAVFYSITVLLGFGLFSHVTASLSLFSLVLRLHIQLRILSFSIELFPDV